jgi:hypothetical protein
MSEPQVEVICKRNSCGRSYQALLRTLFEQWGRLTCPKCGQPSTYNLYEAKLQVQRAVHVGKERSYVTVDNVWSPAVPQGVGTKHSLRKCIRPFDGGVSSGPR